MIKSMLMVLDRQGLLKGDLSPSQRLGLMWLIENEFTDEMALEKFRVINMGLAINPATSADFLTKLIEEETQKEKTEEEKDWVRPSTPEEMEDFLSTWGS